MVFSGQILATVRRKHTSPSTQQLHTYSLLWWGLEGSRHIQVGETSSNLLWAQKETPRGLLEIVHCAFPYLSVFSVWLLIFILVGISYAWVEMTLLTALS